jgi:hypothetical protein
MDAGATVAASDPALGEDLGDHSTSELLIDGTAILTYLLSAMTKR